MLISRTKFPPGGWSFFEAATKWSPPSPMASTFTQTVDQILAHRVQNSRFNLPKDWSAVAAELDAFTCASLRNDPSWSTTAQKKTSYKTVPFIQSQFAKVVGLVESVG